MARSRFRENQVLDSDFISEQEHTFLSLNDAPTTYSGYEGKCVTIKDDGTGLEFTSVSGVGIDTFRELNDTPDTYSGMNGYFLNVKANETGLEFTTGSGVNTILDHGLLQGLSDDNHTQYHNDTRGDLRYYQKFEVDTISGTLQEAIDEKPDNFLELDDTPTTYSGADSFLKIKSDESGIEFTHIDFIDLHDTPTTYSGAADLPLVCNLSETGIMFGLIPETAISGTYFVSYEAGRLLQGATGYRPDLVYFGPVAGLAFDAAKEESCYGSFKIPYAWYDETDIELKINFMNDNAQTGAKTVSWRLAFHAYQEGEYYSDKTPTILDIDTTLASDVAEGMYTVETLYIPPDDVNNPLSIGDMVTFQFYRDGLSGTDDAVGDMVLISLTFELKTGDISMLMG